MTEAHPIQLVVPDEESCVLWETRSDTESFLRELRRRGARQVESIRAIRRLQNASLAEAKELVHFSKTWADMREEADELHHAALEALEQLEKSDEIRDHVAA